VPAVNLDPFHGDDPLGKKSARRRTAISRWTTAPAHIGCGSSIWQSEVHEDVDAEFLTLDPIRIHRTNFPTNDPDDPSWLVCHTSLDPANGTPIRLTMGNQIDWLIDGATMFPTVNDAIEDAQHSVRFINLNFYIKGLISKFTFHPACLYASATHGVRAGQRSAPAHFLGD
jgi:hypothetical protein